MSDDWTIMLVSVVVSFLTSLAITVYREWKEWGE